MVRYKTVRGALNCCDNAKTLIPARIGMRGATKKVYASQSVQHCIASGADRG